MRWETVGERLRVYFDPAEINTVPGHQYEGYPFAWYKQATRIRPDLAEVEQTVLAIKDYVRQEAGGRCERCGHPYVKGLGRWSPCDERCTHGGPVRLWSEFGRSGNPDLAPAEFADQYFDIRGEIDGGFEVDAEWRILTVHHLNGVKHDCRWWNLAALCQRCHLTIQAKVWMDRPYPMRHKDWFAPHAAGFYATKYLGVDLDRGETMARLDELLALEQTHDPLF